MIVLQAHSAVDYDLVIEKATSVLDTRGRLSGQHVDRL